jgi:hypothetical protein
MSVQDPLPTVTTVGLRVAQFIARQKPFLVDFLVPIAVIHRQLKQTFNFQSKMKSGHLRHTHQLLVFFVSLAAIRVFEIYDLPAP